MQESKNQVQYRRIETLKPLENNPRTITGKQMETLEKSLRDNPDYFEARPIILSNRTGELVILAGNQRYMAAKRIGLEEVPCVLIEGLTEEREREIIIRDNVSNGNWDFDILANEWDETKLGEWGVQTPTNFKDYDLDSFFDEEAKEKEPKMITCPYCGKEFEK